MKRSVNLSPVEIPRKNGAINKLDTEDRHVHNWYRFVLSFPPHLVRQYLSKFKVDDQCLVLDPFCGTGTTLVECKKLGIPVNGMEAHPMSHFASMVKVDWSPEPEELVKHAKKTSQIALDILCKDGIEDEPSPRNINKRSNLRNLPVEASTLLLTNSISPLPLHKTLVLLDAINTNRDERFYRHELLALAKALVTCIGNLKFGPEVGVGPPKSDARVVGVWLDLTREIADDLRFVKGIKSPQVNVYHSDSRRIKQSITTPMISAVFTSPPYPNEKDYTRTTRLESVILGFIHNRTDLRSLKKGLIRSNTRNVYKDDSDDIWVAGHSEIQKIAATIEARRIALGKTSGFERLYHKVTTLYFGGMAQHMAKLREVLKPGAMLGYVVGDQASYLRIMIRTGQLLSSIAESLGYEVEGIDLFRTRLATATREQLREEVIVLRWPGFKDLKKRFYKTVCQTINIRS